MLLQPLLDRQISQRGTRCSRFFGAHPLEHGGEFGEGVVGANRALEAAVVVDQITAHLLVLLADLHQRQDFGRAHNGRIHAGFTAVVQEDGVEGDPRSRREAEADVAHAENHMNARQVGGDAPNCFDGFAAIAPVFFDAG